MSYGPSSYSWEKEQDIGLKSIRNKLDEEFMKVHPVPTINLEMSFP